MEDCATFFSTGQSSYTVPVRPDMDSSFCCCKDESSVLISGVKTSTKMEPVEDSFSTASTLSDTGCADRNDRVFTDEDDSTWTILESSSGPKEASESTLELENATHVPPGDDFDLCLTSW